MLLLKSRAVCFVHFILLKDFKKKITFIMLLLTILYSIMLILWQNAATLLCRFTLRTLSWHRWMVLQMSSCPWDSKDWLKSCSKVYTELSICCKNNSKNFRKSYWIKQNVSAHSKVLTDCRTYFVQQVSVYFLSRNQAVLWHTRSFSVMYRTPVWHLTSLIRIWALLTNTEGPWTSNLCCSPSRLSSSTFS